ncbi:septal ring lytic transglycosylase RlpA family protein [Aurantiacibacter zhengii]|uniref:septal ring lytic transglycosylase RlpA family protein n=1 Tax=Aurantiacibacter zhengii TaxID=2307003 RepID=UPI001F1E8BAE|nr:septal ring lytic transglycosylase RlpA family protein [Aurantiacibacter zhengii]
MILLGGGGIGLAQDAPVGTQMSADLAPAARQDQPAFQPSEQAQFETAFARFDTPAEPALPDHAVDITTIEPAEPSATPIGPGVASYYGRRFHGRPTASGEAFDMNDLTAAHKTLPFGSRVRVTNPRNGASVVVRVNDRGPFTRGRDIDLSRAAAEQIGIVRSGHGRVELELLDN